MPETNEQTTSPLQPKEVCAIRIMFPVTSDEQAIACKKKISDTLADIPNVQIQFSISNIPDRAYG